ncbi:MAG TPA: dipeptide/oligopeptide/nickel ABC transporter ATP-binding protein [Conexibacter sp.]|jgi:ABC-type dipeptide/oligopeptide/nickel transport system ATPase subunit|nr:dipeptide/oligopeptide/nickel ABC transporter ATP-binding protein [Conexibacter sp.]
MSTTGRPPAASAVVDVRDVTHEYRRGGVTRTALTGVSLTVERGRTLAIIGESGAGKSTLGRLIAGLETPTHGAVVVNGASPEPTTKAPSPVQMIFQHPTEALDPLMTIERSLVEPLWKLPKRERREVVCGLLERVGIDASRLSDRPAAFSGGQLQRIGIARALAVRPSVLVCDEPTSALDVSVQAQIVNLLLDMQEELGFACVLVTHDLPVARSLADEILVLKDGEVVEHAANRAFFSAPSHAYSQALIAEARGQTVSAPA